MKVGYILVVFGALAAFVSAEPESLAVGSPTECAGRDSCKECGVDSKCVWCGAHLKWKTRNQENGALYLTGRCIPNTREAHVCEHTDFNGLGHLLDHPDASITIVRVSTELKSVEIDNDMDSCTAEKTPSSFSAFSCKECVTRHDGVWCDIGFHPFFTPYYSGQVCLPKAWEFFCDKQMTHGARNFLKQHMRSSRTEAECDKPLDSREYKPVSRSCRENLSCSTCAEAAEGCQWCGGWGSFANLAIGPKVEFPGRCEPIDQSCADLEPKSLSHFFASMPAKSMQSHWGQTFKQHKKRCGAMEWGRWMTESSCGKCVDTGHVWCSTGRGIGYCLEQSGSMICVPNGGALFSDLQSCPLTDAAPTETSTTGGVEAPVIEPMELPTTTTTPEMQPY